MTDNFYITTPIYYVNASPHLGHAYTSILCDVIKRYHSMTGVDSYMLTGTDEHGDKIAQAAEEQKMSPQDMVDKNSENFRKLLPFINISNDDFIRTSDERHQKTVKDIFQKTFDKGDIYFGEYSGKYCFGCERYLSDDELDDGKCPDHQTEPKLITEKNYFFKMSKYWKKIEEYINSHINFVVPEGFKNEVLGILKTEPQDLCISRPKSRLTWGIELPFDKDFVSYVWFEALINYISAMEYPDGEKLKKYWPNAHHVIGKDILRQHCLFWPAMLMSMELPLPKQICIHGYWLSGDTKMSKSLGNVINPMDYCEKYGSDVFRYFLIRGMHFGRDAKFTEEEFTKVYNTDLANKIGNLYSRIVGICRKNCDAKIPELGDVQEHDENLTEKGTTLYNKTHGHIKNWKTFEYADEIVHFAEDINKYLDEEKPWKQIKDPETFDRATSVLRNGLEGVRIIFGLLSPIMPNISNKVYQEMGIEKVDIYSSVKKWDVLKAGHQLPEKISGFPRI